MRQGLVFTGLVTLFCSLFLWAGWVNGKRASDKWWQAYTYVGETQLTSWPTERREGRTNEQIIAYLHNNYPEPEMNNKTLSFDCPKGFDYISLYFPGDVVKGVEVGGLYVGTCLPVKSSVPVVDHQSMKWKANPTLGCDTTWNRYGEQVCIQPTQPDPLPQYTKPVDPVTYEGLTPPSGSSDYHYGKVKPVKPIKTCAPKWDEPVKGTCAVIADGYIIPVEYPKHKAVKCQYLSDVDKSLCYYRLEDQP